ncbi:YraN family protein [uncultured Brevibacillus sp.]|uniref:YraN family protein n=1 Tax=uncultured Brevibacillus sp. TaxID=169970 RepID=UPI002594CF5E|nr:YraN family protein [uncultured Brevibacillus sp.]
MTDQRRALGQKGEQMAEQFLEQKGYEIISRNVRTRRGEIDLIAMDGSALVFVEVRTRASHAFGTALESVTWRKRQKLRELAMEYLQSREGFVPSFRFDVIAVEYTDRGTDEETFRIQHVEHAF